MRTVLTSTLALTFTISCASADNSTWKGVFAPLPERPLWETSATAAGNTLTPAKIALGKRLYLDPRLSKDGNISCNSCHSLSNYGVDNEPTSPGHQGQRGGRNSPSSFNAALHTAQFWDGRAENVEKQALGPILNPIEMAMPSEAAVVERLKSDKTYQTEFATAFPQESDPITYTNVGKAIGAFERTLITPSRFDDFLKGDNNAISADEIRGGQLFVRTGCTACHNGATIGGSMYQKLGLVKPYPTKDLGRYEVTKNEADRMVFKVPSLRNVAKTAPYLHDGSIKTLEEVVSLMGEYQLGKQLPPQDVKDIVTFLNALTADKPKSGSFGE